MTNSIVSGRGMLQENTFLLAYGHSEGREVRRVEKNPLPLMACHQILISAFSARILVVNLGRAACSNSIPTHSLRYHSHQSLFSPLLCYPPPFCLYIIDSFGVALTVCLIITCFWVTAQEEMDMVRKEHKVKGRHAFHSSHVVRGMLHHLEWYVCA